MGTIKCFAQQTDGLAVFVVSTATVQLRNLRNEAQFLHYNPRSFVIHLKWKRSKLFI